MTYMIAEPCVDVKNQSCVDVCPVSCIYIGDEAADRILYINPDECIECGACEPECPVTAIFHDSAVPAEWAEYTRAERQVVQRRRWRPREGQRDQPGGLLTVPVSRIRGPRRCRAHRQRAGAVSVPA